MKSNLVQGKLPTPISLPAALARLEEVAREVENIGFQIADPIRAMRLPGYDAWKVRAKSCRRHLQREAELLSLWIEQQPGADLLRDVRAALRAVVEVAGTIEDPDLGEVEVMVRARAVLARLDAILADKANGAASVAREG